MGRKATGLKKTAGLPEEESTRLFLLSLLKSGNRKQLSMEGSAMNRTIMAATFALLLAAAPAMAQMTGGYGQHMMEQEQQVPPQQQHNPYQMNPGMMGGGYGMHPGMMGGYGYGMGPQMMGGYGYGMHPNMMGGNGMGHHMMGGYGMHPNMMGGYGYGMHPGMMGGYGYGMGPQMMGGCGMHSPYGGYQGPNYKSNEEYGKFLNDTRDKRRKLHDLMFDYSEARHSPEPDREKLQDMEKEMNELRTEIFSYKAK